MRHRKLELATIIVIVFLVWACTRQKCAEKCEPKKFPIYPHWLEPKVY